MEYQTPFKDTVGDNSVPVKGSGSGSYDTPCVPDTPHREGGMYPELTYDTHWGAPKNSGPIKDSPFKDDVS